MDNMVYKGNKPYAFISYSHADTAKVEYLLRCLYNNGIRFWYDKGIEAGGNWSETIDNALYGSSSFVLFLSNGAEQRAEIIREINMAIGLRKERGESYKILIVLLERVPVSYIFHEQPEILDFVMSVQYISVEKFGGVTMEFLKSFISREIWPEEMIDDDIRRSKGLPPQLTSSSAHIKLDGFEDISSKNNYIYEQACPVKQSSDGISFYCVSVGETDPNAVYPLCMDNQWCPPTYFSRDDFREKGFLCKELLEERNMLQQTEVYRALIHNWQILINRASVFNSDAVIQWYLHPGPQRDTFCELLDNGSFVIYLMNEKDPLDKTPFDRFADAAESWAEICRQHTIYCIRFDWHDDDNNCREAAMKLSSKFRDLLLTTADDGIRLDMLCRALNIPQDKAPEFRALWKQVRDRVIQNSDEKISDYSRNMIYQDFIVRKDTNVPECRIDYSKPFVCELKRIVDFCYMMNLPRALNIRPLIPNNDSLRSFDIMESQERKRIMSAAELYCSVISFRRDFLDKTIMMPQSCRMDLTIVSRIRKMPEWRLYIQALDAGRKRANLNEIDFHDMEYVWECFRTLMNSCSKALPELEWKECAGSVSVIYRIGENDLISVYRGGEEAIKICTDESLKNSARARENMAVDFVFADILEENIRSNCFLTEQRLFEGRSLEPNKDVYERILSALKVHPHSIMEKHIW